MRFLILCSFLLSTTQLFAQTKTTTTTTEKVYTYQEREDLRTKLENKLAETSKDIEELKADMKKSGAAAQEKLKSEMTALDVKRNELAENLRSLSRSSESAWSELSAGSQRAYRELSESFKRAQKKFKETK